jgi:hypothetical protein
MAFSLVLSPDAINDIDIAFEYYNKLSDGLGFEFTDTIDTYLKKNSKVSHRFGYPVRQYSC